MLNAQGLAELLEEEPVRKMSRPNCVWLLLLCATPLAIGLVFEVTHHFRKPSSVQVMPRRGYEGLKRSHKPARG